MAASAKNLLRQAIELPADERAVLADQLIESLQQSDTKIDAAWLRESEHRMDAYHSGDLDATDASEVFSDLEKHT